jgi:hypothetical protein
VETSKSSEIPRQRDNDTNTKVIGIRKAYLNFSYVYHPGKQKWILFKRLKLRELAPICKEINPIGQYRFMDFTFHLDASCLNDNWADRNKVTWFDGLETIKTIRSLTHDLL